MPVVSLFRKLSRKTRAARNVLTRVPNIPVVVVAVVVVVLVVVVVADSVVAVSVVAVAVAVETVVALDPLARVVNNPIVSFLPQVVDALVRGIVIPLPLVALVISLLKDVVVVRSLILLNVLSFVDVAVLLLKFLTLWRNSVIRISTFKVLLFLLLLPKISSMVMVLTTTCTAVENSTILTINIIMAAMNNIVKVVVPKINVMVKNLQVGRMTATNKKMFIFFRISVTETMRQ